MRWHWWRVSIGVIAIVSIAVVLIVAPLRVIVLIRLLIVLLLVVVVVVILIVVVAGFVAKGKQEVWVSFIVKNRCSTSQRYSILVPVKSAEPILKHFSETLQ